MEKINLKNGIEVTLEQTGKTSGKVTVTSWRFNGSYHWGAMGMPLLEFVEGIDSHYFAKNVGSHNTYTASPKATVKGIRKWWKDEGLPWYECRDEQKEFREALRDMENSNTVSEGFEYLKRMFDFLFEDEMKEALSPLIDGFWQYFIETAPSEEFKFFQSVHDELKPLLKKLIKQKAMLAKKDRGFIATQIG